MPSSTPADRNQATRIALIVAIVVVAVAVVGMVAWAALRPRQKASMPRTKPPAEETSRGATPTSSSVEASGTTPTQSPGSTPVTSSTSPDGVASPGPARVAKIAFRKGSAIHVADEDGGSARPVATAADGTFALSPDGQTLAVARSGNFALYGVADGKLAFSARGEAVTPVWLPDSSAVLFVRGGADGSAQVYRVPSSGGAEMLIGTGSNMAVSPDGEVIVLVPALGSVTTPRVMVSRGGAAFAAIPVQGGDALAVEVSNDRIFVSTTSASAGSGIWSMSLHGSDPRQLVQPGSSAEKGATFGRLALSPDGSKLAYAAESDDGYSRMFVVPAKGGTAFSLSFGRDDYPLGWSVSGKEILFIEGNAFQGESTALFHVSPSGSRRLLLVNGAGL